MKKIQILSFFAFALIFSCKPSNTLLYQFEQTATADSAMVVSAHPLATRAGVEILRKGGNAVDASIAVQFALAVVYPRAGNLGGGGFLLLRQADGKVASIDFREKAPLAAGRDMYLDSLGDPIEDLSRIGHKAVGVPGSVDGLIKAYQKHGQIKDFSELVGPAIKLCREGFRITESEAERLNRFQGDFQNLNPPDCPFVKEEEWKAGDLLVQPELAYTLELIRDRGRDGFYKGFVADQIIAEMEQGNGLITYDDLEQYQAKWREPLQGKYKDYNIISMGPPSSGGVAIIQLLEFVEPFPLREWGFQKPKSIHVMVEAMRRAYADRAEHLGDMDYYPTPLEELLDSAYLAERMANFRADHATESKSIFAGNFEVALESFETTHTSVADQAGNAVSVTTTLNSNYGSKVWVERAGFFLNNEMDDFSVKPGVPNQFGLFGAEANAIEPGKRMLSSMTPTIVEKDGGLFMVLGTPGGSTIITSVFQVLLNVVEFGMDLEQAVAAKRFHHQWLPDEIWFEKEGLGDTTQQSLAGLGHRLVKKEQIAKMKAIHRLPDGRLAGVGDPRNPDDCAEGY